MTSKVPPSESTGKPRRARRRWWLWSLLALLLLAVLGIGLLPTWLSTDTGRRFWTGIVNERARGTMAVDSADLGWSGETRMAGLVLTNPPGFGDEPMLTVESVDAEIGLWTLLGGDFDIVLTAKKPRLHVVRLEDGRLNVMEWWPREEKDSNEPRPGSKMTIELIDGQLVYDDRALGTKTVFEDVHLECRADDLFSPIRSVLKARLAGEGSGTVQLETDLTVPEIGWTDPARLAGSLSLSLDRLASSNWLSKSFDQTKLAVLGAELDGGLKVGFEGARIIPSIDLTVRDLRASGGVLTQPFQNESATFRLEAVLPLDSEPAHWEALQLEAPFLGVDSKGRLEDAMGSPRLESSWTIRYDLSKLPDGLSQQFGEWGLTKLPAGSADVAVQYGGEGSWAQKLGLSGQWIVGDLEVLGSRFRETKVDLGWAKGALSLKPSGRLNGGTFQLTANVAPETEAVSFEGQLDGVGLAEGLLSALQYTVPFLAGTGTAPASAGGKLTGKLALSSKGFDVQEVLDSLSGSGGLSISDLTLTGSALLGAIGQQLELPGLKVFEGVTGHFEVDSGRVSTEDLKLNGQKVSFYLDGSTDFDGSIDYAVSSQLVADLLSKHAGPLGKILSKQQGLTKIPLSVDGTLTDPTVKVELEEMARSLGQTLEEALGGAVDQALGDLKERATGGGSEKGTDSSTAPGSDLLGSVAGELQRQKYEKDRDRATEKAEAVLRVVTDAQGRLKRSELANNAGAIDVLRKLLALPVSPPGSDIDPRSASVVALRIDKYNAALTLATALGDHRSTTYRALADETADLGPEGRQKIGAYRDIIPTASDPRLELALTMNGMLPMPAGHLLSRGDLAAGSAEAARRFLARTTEVEGQAIGVSWYVFARGEVLTNADPDKQPAAFQKGVRRLLLDFLPADHPARKALEKSPSLEIVRAGD
ncbi:MAG: AsmA-like C-terminal region-containing protein [Planctomycetota bacterium]